jgi:hypothetical protein
MPGFADISGYKPAAYIKPSVIISLNQFEYLANEFRKVNETWEQIY